MLRNHNESLDYDEKSPVAKAIYEVFESVGDDVSFYRGVLSGSAEALERVRTRAQMNPANAFSISYTDRRGKLHMPFDEALELGRRFCAIEPTTVLTGVESTERKWSQQARRPGEEYIVSLLNEYRAVWWLIRQWTGHDPAIAQREAEIAKLERLVWDAVYALQKAGLDREATRLRRP
jgi:hypothetical protein